MKTALRLLIALTLLTLAFGIATGSAQAHGVGQEVVPGRVVFANDFVLRAGQIMEGNLQVLAAQARLESGSVLKGNLQVLGGRVLIEHGALINGDVSITGGEAFINGHVTGDVSVLGGEVQLGKGARIDGRVHIVAGTVHHGGFVQPPWYRLPNREEPWGYRSSPEEHFFNFFWKFSLVVWYSVVLGLLAGVAALLAPNVLREVGKIAILEWLPAVGVGVIGFMVVPVLALLLLIFIVAVPILLVVAGFLVLLGWFGGGYAIGERLEFISGSYAEPIRAALGTAILVFIAGTANLVPCIGWVVPTLVSIWAFGAAIIWLYRAEPLNWFRRKEV